MTSEELKQMQDDLKNATEFISSVRPVLEAVQELIEISPDLKDALDWVAARKIQQIANPIDEASESVLELIKTTGEGVTAKTQVAVTSGGQTVTVPKAYLGTRLFRTSEGDTIEVPYIARS